MGDLRANETPWVDKALRPVWGRVEAAAPKRAWLPKSDSGSSKKMKVVEYGCGHYGCVMPTEDDEIVFKLTSDLTEAQFVAAALKIGDQPDGLVRYEAIYELPGVSHRGRPLFIIWREAATHVGLPIIYPGEKYDYERNALRLLGRFLDQFKQAAADVRERLKSGDMEQKLREAERHKQHAWEATMEFDWERAHSNEVQRALSHLRGSDRLALGLAICRSLTEVMGNTYGSDLIGDTLGFYLERGILLADVHRYNVGTTPRSGKTYVITDPGHAVFLDPKLAYTRIPWLP
jgi:Sec-independent protein translocase protein TatA